jgi:hypothetical protein
MFSYDRGFNKDGIFYAAQQRFRSTEAHYDWFPFGGSFHLSSGVLVYNGNQITANASVRGGNTFTRNNTTYASDPTDPITGTGKVDFAKAGPMFTVGWGNLLPLATTTISASLRGWIRLHRCSSCCTQHGRRCLRRRRNVLPSRKPRSHFSGKRPVRKEQVGQRYVRMQVLSCDLGRVRVQFLKWLARKVSRA